MWEVVFMLPVLELPVLHVGAVVSWATRAEPRPGPARRVARARSGGAGLCPAGAVAGEGRA